MVPFTNFLMFSARHRPVYITTPAAFQAMLKNTAQSMNDENRHELKILVGCPRNSFRRCTCEHQRKRGGVFFTLDRKCQSILRRHCCPSITRQNEHRSYDKVVRTISGEFHFDRQNDRQSLADIRIRVVICDTQRRTRPDKPSGLGRNGESNKVWYSIPK
jgi:hypothetical protein